MNRDKQKHTIDILFVITLFCVFAFSIIMLMGTGARVYSRIVERMETNYESRTASTYLFNKIHRADAEGLVKCGYFGDAEALLMMEEVNNVPYCTYLYYYDNSLMELFTRYGQDISPEYGTKIMTLADYDFEQVTNSLYRFSFVTEEGESSVLYVHTRSDEKINNE